MMTAKEAQHEYRQTKTLFQKSIPGPYVGLIRTVMTTENKNIDQ